MICISVWSLTRAGLDTGSIPQQWQLSGAPTKGLGLSRALLSKGNPVFPKVHGVAAIGGDTVDFWDTSGRRNAAGSDGLLRELIERAVRLDFTVGQVNRWALVSFPPLRQDPTTGLKYWFTNDAGGTDIRPSFLQVSPDWYSVLSRIVVPPGIQSASAGFSLQVKADSPPGWSPKVDAKVTLGDQTLRVIEVREPTTEEQKAALRATGAFEFMARTAIVVQVDDEPAQIGSLDLHFPSEIASGYFRVSADGTTVSKGPDSDEWTRQAESPRVVTVSTSRKRRVFVTNCAGALLSKIRASLLESVPITSIALPLHAREASMNRYSSESAFVSNLAKTP